MSSNDGRRIKTKVLRVDGLVKTINSQTITVVEEDNNGDVLRCRGTVTVTASGSGYAKGCQYIKTDASTGVQSLYENIGTNTSCNFNLIGAIAAGEITLPEAQTLIGTSGSVAAAKAVGGDLSVVASGSWSIRNFKVTAGKIDTASVIAAKIGANAVTTAKLDTASVTAPKITAYAVKAASLDTGSVTTAKIPSFGVTAAKLDTAAVDAAKLASFAVQTAKIDTNSVTLLKLAPSIISQRLVQGAGVFKTVGGDTTETISVTGLRTTDSSIVWVAVAGTSSQAIATWSNEADQIRVTFAGDPSNNHRVGYIAHRGIA